MQEAAACCGTGHPGSCVLPMLAACLGAAVAVLHISTEQLQLTAGLTASSPAPPLNGACERAGGDRGRGFIRCCPLNNASSCPAVAAGPGWQCLVLVPRDGEAAPRGASAGSISSVGPAHGKKPEVAQELGTVG